MMKSLKMKMIMSMAFCLVMPIPFAQGQDGIVKEHTTLSEAAEQRVKAVSTYFNDADGSVQALAQKIASQTPITLDDMKALPEGALNARYEQEITLLFFALLQRNLQAVDMLLKAGADPYMVDHPSQGSKLDFTYYMSEVALPHSYEETQKFRTELVRIYLANGGDPNLWLGSPPLAR